MLSLMRKHAGSWMIKVILFAITVVFVFWGVGSFTSRNQTQVADVNGEIISVEVYRQAYYRLLDNYRRLYGDQFNDDLLKMLRPGQQALEGLISRILMVQESDRLGIDVSEQELADSIQAMPAFQNNGVFDYQRYQQLLGFNKMSPEQFETNQRQDLRIGKLQALITSAVSISEEEARQWYEWNNAEVNLEYVLFESEKYSDVTPTREQIETYFEKNVIKYRTEPQVKVRYLFFDPGAYQEDVSITQEAVSEYYQQNADEFRTESLEQATPNIRKKLRLKRSRMKALEAAERVYDSVFDGDDLGEAGKTHQVPVMDTELFTASGIKDKKIGNAREFAKTAFELDLMAISRIQDWEDGYYLLQVIERLPSKSPELESVVERVRPDVTKELQKERAKADAAAMLADIKNGTLLAEASRSAALQVKDTGFFKRTGGTGTIGYEPQIAEAAFELTVDQPLADPVVEGRNGWYVLRLKERKLPLREEFVKELKSTRQRLAAQRKQAVFQQWIAGLKERSEIAINQERVEQQ